MSRPVTPGATAPLLNSTPATAQSQSHPQRSFTPVSAVHGPNQAQALSRSNSQRVVSSGSGMQQSNQAPNLSRSNSQRQYSTASGVQGPIHGPNPAPALSRSNTQKSGHAGSRPVSYVGGDATNNEFNDRQSAIHREDTELSQGGFVNDEDHIAVNDASSGLHRSKSQASQSGTTIPSRGSTLKKKSSLKKSASLKRSGSKKSSYAGSVRSMQLGEKEKYEPNPEHNSVFHCPVPTSGSPTDLLADRFQAWRRVLKDLINYFRDAQKSHEARAKTLASASNTINNTSSPSNFLNSGGILEAGLFLREYHKVALSESNKSKDLYSEVILQLTGLRSDLQQKIKEIKSLSGDFKNSVGKETEASKKVVRSLQESLGHVDHDAASSTGKGDPFLVKMHVDRQIEKQIEEENYLHRAYLNLEASGRELESIVVGEIQKAYTVLANGMKRDADNTYECSEKLRGGPLAMAKDYEWDEFVVHSNQMVDPRVPLRQAENITYNGKDHPAAIEVKSGMLERKSKYLKNYTPGWYVLSPTHLHEFKSADKIASQSPVMSLYLPEQKLGTHSEPGSTSHKFMLKGRQAGGMHRGHSWIFRAETHDTMMAWFGDIKELTEKRGEERNEFVRRTHARTLSSGSKAASIGSVESGIEEDEADKIPFSTEQSIRGNSVADGPGGVEDEGYIMDDNRSDPGWRPPQRPTPGGRFPSDVNVERGLAAPLSPSSGDSYDETDRDAIAAAGALPGSDLPYVAGSAGPQSDLQQGYDRRSMTQSNYSQQNNIEPGYGQQSNIQSGYGQQGDVQPGYGQQGDVQSGYGQQNNIQSGYGQQNNLQSEYGQQTNAQPSYEQQNAKQPTYASQTYASQTYAQSGNDMAGTAASANNANSTAGIQSYTSGDHPGVAPTSVGVAPVENASNYGEWMAPMAAGVGGAAIGAGGAHLYQNAHSQNQQPAQMGDQQRAIPEPGQSSGPIMASTAAPINAPTRPRGMTESTQDTENTATAMSYAPSSNTTSTVPTSVSLIGTEAPAPSQTLLAAGINPYPTRKSYPMQPVDPSVRSTTLDAAPAPVPVPIPTPAPVLNPAPVLLPASNITKAPGVSFDTTNQPTGMDTLGDLRPQMPPGSKSVQTISDLHVPGEFPRQSPNRGTT